VDISLDSRSLVKIAIGFFIVPLLLVGIMGGMMVWFGSGDLQNQTHPQEAPSSQATKEIPPDLIPIYQAAAQKYHIPWNLLAAVNKVETNFGKDLSTSHTGARGWMQFQPCTWMGWNYSHCDRHGDLTKPIDITNPKNIAKYGGYGVDGNGDGRADPMNPHDAIYTAANYLAANGASSGQIEKAVYAYNHSKKYVNDVLAYSAQFAGSAVNVGGQNLSFGGKFIWPVPSLKDITSPFGNRVHPISGRVKMHAGIDIGGPSAMGQPVLAAASGKVDVRYDAGGYGNYVVIDHGGGFKTLYGHLSKVFVKTGQVVQQNQTIAAVGNTGGSTGAHLHFEVQKNDAPQQPLNYVRQP
jgi:murein DD-endopeptidase MepM/ murein hydrolase activator NlpD